ncbi:MAG: CAP domain-containing protein [bacterium]|nr:CAP domain-containing protein [bacterium]
MKMKSGKKRKKGKYLLLYLILASFIVKLFAFIFKKERREKIMDNFKDFFNKEKKEVEELANNEESFEKYCGDSSSIFKDYFIPCDSNSNKPKILRIRALTAIVVVLILIKLAATGYLFFIYPSKAKMAEEISKQILELINQERTANNLSPLSTDPALNNSALAKARDMLNNNYFAHKSPGGKMPWDWINRGEYGYLFVGENLAMNFTSAQSAHAALMLSESHKKNILNDKYADIGLAVLPGVIDGKQTNILVELFASKKPIQLAEAKAPEAKTAAEAPITAALPDNAPVFVLPTNIEKTETEPITEKSQPEADQPLKSGDLTVVSGAINPDALSDKKNAQDISPNQALENNEISEVKFFAPQKSEKNALAAKIIKTSSYIFIFALAIVAVSLLINIFVRISIQHKPVIVQSLLVIIFITGLLFTKLHFLENILDKIAVL